jgi:beta-glucosidase
VTVSVSVSNTGSRAGDEVVQLYLRDDVSSVTTHDLALVGFERIHLEPGERRQVRLTIPPAALQLIDRAGNRVVEPGRFTVWLGGSSADLRLEGAFTVRAAE